MAGNLLSHSTYQQYQCISLTSPKNSHQYLVKPYEARFERNSFFGSVIRWPISCSLDRHPKSKTEPNKKRKGKPLQSSASFSPLTTVLENYHHLQHFMSSTKFWGERIHANPVHHNPWFGVPCMRPTWSNGYGPLGSHKSSASISNLKITSSYKHQMSCATGDLTFRSLQFSIILFQLVNHHMPKTKERNLDKWASP